MRGTPILSLAIDGRLTVQDETCIAVQREPLTNRSVLCGVEKGAVVSKTLCAV